MMKMARSIVLLSMGLLAVGCDSSKPAAKEPPPEARASAPAAETPPPVEPVPAAMPPAPEGTVAVQRLFVHTCAEPHPCPLRLRDAGAAHCAALQLGGLTWRLPSIEELESWRGNPALTGYDAFHWSGSAWDQDPSQWWIYDPASGSKTTAPPDRKPFTIRCVAAPTGT